MSYLRSSRLIVFFLMLLVYLLTMGVYYFQTHKIIIEETEKSIENILLTQRALSHLVSDIQKSEINRLQDEGILHEDYFSPALLSSSYITKKLNDYTNIERKDIGRDPLVFKYASPNPTNLENLADHYDMMVYEKLQDENILKHKETMTKDGKTYLYYAIAGKKIEQKCLQCHSTPDVAPKSLVQQYGDTNGFGLKVGDLSAIISIRVPLDNIYLENDKKLIFPAIVIFVIFVVLFILGEFISKHLRHKEHELKLSKAIQEKNIAKAKALDNSLSKLYTHVLRTQFTLEGIVTEASDALYELSGYPVEELIGQKFCYFKHPDNPPELFEDIWTTINSGKVWTGEVKNMSKEGEIFWVEATISPLHDQDESVYAYESIMRIITEKKALLNDIERDPMTKLLNRRGFETRFTDEKNRALRDGKYFAFMMIDIDFFKEYNDNYGHLQGDEALKAVSRSLEASFQRASDCVFRLGGEEFAILSSAHNEKAVKMAAQRCRKNIENLKLEHSYSNVSKFLTISMGVAIMHRSFDAKMSDVYAQSDKSLYEAKKSGRNQIKYTNI